MCGIISTAKRLNFSCLQQNNDVAMRTVKRVYKTKNGFFRNSTSKTCSISDFFGDNVVFFKGEVMVRKVASNDLKREVAELFVNRNFSNKSKATKEFIINSLIHVRCDLSFFQCFYTSGGNSLSGTSYDYCKRGFMKSVY